MGGIIGGNWSFEDLHNMGIKPEEITGQKAIELGPKPTTKNVPALRRATTAVPGQASAVESPVRPARRVYGDPVGAPRGGGGANLPSVETRPNWQTNGQAYDGPPVSNTRPAGANLPALRQAPIVEGEFRDLRARPTAATYSQQFGGRGGAQPIDPTGGALGAIYRAASRATSHTDKLGNRTRLTIPGVEQMFGGYKDDATFKEARQLVQDGMKNHDSIPTHNNYNDPKEVFKGALPARSSMATPPSALAQAKLGAVQRPQDVVSTYDSTADDASRMEARQQSESMYAKQAADTDARLQFAKDQEYRQSQQTQLGALRANAAELARPRTMSGIDEYNMNFVGDANLSNPSYKNALVKKAAWDFENKSRADALGATNAQIASMTGQRKDDLTDSTTRRGQDETSEWRKQQSADALEGRKFTAEQGRLGRETTISEGALNRKESQEARIAADKEKSKAANATRITEARLRAQQAAEKLYPDDPIRQQESIMQSQALISPELYDYDPPTPEIKEQKPWLARNTPGQPRKPGALRAKTPQTQAVQTATNPTTGEKMVLKNGKWEKA